MVDDQYKQPLYLTPRERDVCEAMVLTDGSNAQIAEHLGIGEATVRTHLMNISRKNSMRPEFGNKVVKLQLAVRFVMMRFHETLGVPLDPFDHAPTGFLLKSIEDFIRSQDARRVGAARRRESP